MYRSLCLLAILAFASSVQGFYPTEIELKQKEMTDSCLLDISKIATVIPKIIDDITRGDMVSLMTDVLNALPLINQTKNHCSALEVKDMINQTTYNNIRYCAQSFGPIADSLEVLGADIIHGKFTKVYDDLLTVLANAAYSLRVCGNIADFIEYPKVIFNFFNTTQCWNAHQRSANLLSAILHDLQVGNMTDALNLALPFVSATADSLRFCTINISAYDNTSYINNDEVLAYNFLEIDESTIKQLKCKAMLAEITMGLTTNPQDLGKILAFLPKLKDCAEAVDLAQLIKNPVVKKIVSQAWTKSLN